MTCCPLANRERIFFVQTVSHNVPTAELK